MSNKVNDINGNRTAPVSAGRAVERARDVTTGSKDSPASEASEVEITGAARHLAALEKALARQPAVDEARAAAIRNDIEQGRYKVNAEHTADQYLQLERALGRLER